MKVLPFLLPFLLAVLTACEPNPFLETEPTSADLTRAYEALVEDSLAQVREDLGVPTSEAWEQLVLHTHRLRYEGVIRFEYIRANKARVRRALAGVGVDDAVIDAYIDDHSQLTAAVTLLDAVEHVDEAP